MKYQIYKRSGKWRWRLRAANNEIVASGEGYESKQACLDGIALVKMSYNAPVEEVEEEA